MASVTAKIDTSQVRRAATHLRLLAAAIFLYCMAWLALTVPVIAVLGGLEPVVISSGSMSPLIRAGDIVLLRRHDGPLDEGTVITYVDGALGTERLVTHRIDVVTRDGYITKGDANNGADSDLVPPDRVVGVAAALVPFAGLPVHWLTAGAWLPLLGWLAITVVALTSVLPERGRARPPDGHGLGPARRGRTLRQGRLGRTGRGLATRDTGAGSRRFRSQLVLAGLMLAAASTLVMRTPASDAALSDTAGNQANTLTAGHWANVVALAAGESHTCAALGDGSVWCWGLNDNGQLGDNTTTDRLTPVQVTGTGGTGTLDGAVGVTAGQKHTCAVKGNGTAWCWGDNSGGELGDNTTTDRHAPVQVTGVGGVGTLSGVASAAAGLQHTCAALTAGTAFCWGLNDQGQLGDNSTTQRNAPIQVLGVGAVGTLSGVADIAAGSKHTCVVLTGAQARCWGLNDRGQLGDNSTTQRNTPVAVLGLLGLGNLTNGATITAGESHTCVARTDGGAWCWGLNSSGQVGDNSTTQRNVPVAVVAAAGLGNLTGIDDVAAGGKHTCAVMTDGTMWCWGLNSTGQVGDNSTTQRNRPVQVVGPGGTGTLASVTLGAAGSAHTCAARSNDTLWCWGSNASGQLGDNSTTQRDAPVLVKGPRETGAFNDVVALAAGESHTCAALGDGSVWCWGLNDNGQLGDNTTTDRLTPVQVTGTGGTGTLDGAVGVTAGQKHTCAVKGNGTAWCWGDNSGGELGDNTTTDRHAPVQVTGVGGVGTLSGVASAAAGLQHTCAALTAGTAFCWGLNDQGQLGDNSTTQRNAPIQVLGVGAVGTLSGVADIAAGSKHTCVVLTSAQARCWGLNDRGQLGDNSTTQRNTPVAVLGLLGLGNLTNGATITAGESHTCVARTDGGAWCWGLNSSGQVGDNSTTQRNVPVAVVAAAGLGNLTGIDDVAAGGKHTCAVMTDGTMWCWGLNSTGQVGDNSTTQRNRPVQVVGVGGVGTFSDVAIAAGGSAHTCAANTETKAYCWGLNASGQLGIGTTGNVSTPTRVL